MTSLFTNIRIVRRALFLFVVAGLWVQGCAGDNTNSNTNSNTNLNANSNTNNNQSSGPIEPLSASTFLYIKYPGNDGVGHVYAYDWNTKKSRLITDLDGKTKTPSISVSPDRKWFALRAYFRPNDTDLKQGILVPSLWVISVDGKLFRRVTEPILNSNTSGASCTVDSQCASTGWCNVSIGKCSLRNFSIGLETPRWSRDGKTLWTVQSQYWSQGTKVTGGGVLASVPVSGGVLKTYNTNSGCAQVSNISLHPKEDKLVAIHTSCTSGKPGLHIYDIPPTTPTQLFFQADVSVALGTTVFFPDGAGVLFLANSSWDTNNDKKPDLNGIGIAAFDLGKKQLAAILPPLQTHLSYTDMTLSPDGKQIIMCIFDSQKTTNNLYVLDATNKDKPFQPIIEDGKSCNPSW